MEIKLFICIQRNDLDSNFSFVIITSNCLVILSATQYFRYQSVFRIFVRFCSTSIIYQILQRSMFPPFFLHRIFRSNGNPFCYIIIFPIIFKNYKMRILDICLFTVLKIFFPVLFILFEAPQL